MYYLNTLIPLAKNYSQLIMKFNWHKIIINIQNINLFLGLDENLYVLNKQMIKLNFNYVPVMNTINPINVKNYATLLL
jgi:hypothetical protein